MSTFKIKKIKELPYYFAEHCFGFFIILVFLAIVCGWFIFYEYSKHPKIQDLDALLRFDEETYQEVLQIWEEQEQKIEQSESKQYPSLFEKEQEKEQEQEIKFY